MFSAGGQSISDDVVDARAPARSALRSRSSRPACVDQLRLRRAIRSWFAGHQREAARVDRRRSAAAASQSPSSTSVVERCERALVDAAAHRRVALRIDVDQQHAPLGRGERAARLTAVVVLPTPPFWLATAMTRFMDCQAYSRQGKRYSEACPECAA